MLQAARHIHLLHHSSFVSVLIVCDLEVAWKVHGHLLVLLTMGSWTCFASFLGLVSLLHILIETSRYGGPPSSSESKENLWSHHMIFALNWYATKMKSTIRKWEAFDEAWIYELTYSVWGTPLGRRLSIFSMHSWNWMHSLWMPFHLFSREVTFLS